VSRQHTVTVNILDKDYQVACPPDQEGELVAAAKHLDHAMRDIRATGKVIGLERVAIMAALNMSHELLAARDGRQAKPFDDHEDRLKSVTSQLDEALYELRQLEIG
jgi:cell division protein ZapA